MKAIEKSMGLKVADIKDIKEKEEEIENQNTNVDRQHNGELLNGDMAMIMQKYQLIERNEEVVDYGNNNKIINKNIETNRIIQTVNEKQKELNRAMYYKREDSMKMKKSGRMK